jgi:hypothetical protein
MDVDDWRASVNGYRCGGEGGGTTGRFVSWLWAEIQPPKEGVRKNVMVDDGSAKIMVLTVELLVDFEKMPKTFPLGASS